VAAMTTRHEPFTSLVDSWDSPELVAARHRLTELDSSLDLLPAAPPDVCRGEGAEQLLFALAGAGPDGRLVTTVLLAPVLDRVATDLARTWRADADEVAADVAAEAWDRIGRPATAGRMWVQLVGRTRLSVRHRLAIAARQVRRRTELTDDVAADDPDPAEAAANADACVRRLGRLDPGDLIVVVATRHAGWSVQDWAAHHQLHPSRVYSSRRRAETRLRQAS